MSKKAGTFLAMYHVDPATGCWIWEGRLTPKGYTACVNYEGRKVSAYRAFYLALRGQIPHGLHLDHLCSNRRCVNPDHLEPVSSRENLRRAGGVKLSASDVATIKSEIAKGTPNGEIARRFKVVRSQICNIKAGLCWQDVEAAS